MILFSLLSIIESVNIFILTGNILSHFFHFFPCNSKDTIGYFEWLLPTSTDVIPYFWSAFPSQVLNNYLLSSFKIKLPEYLLTFNPFNFYIFLSLFIQETFFKHTDTPL